MQSDQEEEGETTPQYVVKKKKSMKAVIDDSDEEECAFAEKIEESSQDEQTKPGDAAATRRVVERIRVEDNARSTENKKRQADTEARMLSHADKGDTASDDGSDSESSLLPENRKKNKNRRLCGSNDKLPKGRLCDVNIDDIDFDVLNEEHLNRQVRPASTKLTITAILKERGLYAEDLLRRAESVAFVFYAANPRLGKPTKAEYSAHSFETYEYDETDEVNHEVRAFLSNVVTKALEALAKEKIKLGWRKLFNDPSDAPVAPVVAPQVQPPYVVPTKQQPWQTKDNTMQNNSNNNGGLRRGNGMETNDYGNRGQQQGRSNGNFDSNYNGNNNGGNNMNGSYASGFNMQPQYNKENGFTTANNFVGNGVGKPFVSNGNDKPFGSDRGQPSVIVDQPVGGRVYFAQLLEALHVREALQQRASEQMPQGSSMVEIAERAEKEFSIVRMKCGEQMPKRNRPRDLKNYNIYGPDDLEDMQNVVRNVVNSLGLQCGN